mgnify:CR=1 FL=1
MKTTQFLTGLILAGVIFTGCKKDEESAAGSSLDTLKSETKTTYSEIAYANYSDALSTAKKLKTEIDAFVLSPSEVNLEAAKTAWLESREPYGQTEAFRFSEGPIDDSEGPEGLLNAWPLDEGYIDVTSLSDSGIVGRIGEFPDLTATVLEGANEVGGESNVAIGYHAIEFLLWGQDLSDPSDKLPGQRLFTDYTTAANYSRRGDYLKVCAVLLVDHLQGMVDEWDPSKSNNFRATFLGWDNDYAIQTVLTGIGILSKGELAGERMFVALTNQDQEDEHSCFSDNTHRDIILNAQGIRNILIGEYTTVDGSLVSGTSLEDVIKKNNLTLASELEVLSLSTIAECEVIPVPFDYALTQETVSGNGPIKGAVLKLQSQGDKIAEILEALGYSVSVELTE